MTDDARHRGLTPAGDLAPQASNLDALMIEVSLTAGRGTVTVCDHDYDPGLVSILPLASRCDAKCAASEGEAHADAVIFGWLVSP